MNKERLVVFHQGIFKKTVTTAEAVFMITGLTIGAGVLGLPYAIATIGVWWGTILIVIIGIGLLFLNLKIGQVVNGTKEPLQLPGLVGKYLGSTAKDIFSFLIVCSSYGALLAYIVGEGEVVSTLLGQSARLWSVIFWCIGATIIWFGLGAAKKIQTILSLIVMSSLIVLSLFLLPHASLVHVTYTDTRHFFYPWGVIVFSLYALPAIAEAHALLPRKPQQFRKALVVGTLIPMGIYILFVTAVVGVFGFETPEIATTGFALLFNKKIIILGNLIAMCAMGSGFVGLGIALKQVYVWDFKLKNWLGYFLTVSIPLLLFLSGIRSFIIILTTVGSVFISLQMVILVIMCLKAGRSVKGLV